MNKIDIPKSTKYWMDRYDNGDNSGVGSYSKMGMFKAEVLNDFVHTNNIASVIEFGCGDGSQLSLSEYPKYIGIDVSQNAIERCLLLFSNDETKKFELLDDHKATKCSLSISLDVIFHLIEDFLFNDYMERLFSSAERFCIIYSSNKNAASSCGSWHVKHRKFTDWVTANEPSWELIDIIPNKYPWNGDYRSTSFCQFHIFHRK
mgnify:CR=1 FL=1